MAGEIWVIAEVVDGHLARISAEAATLARQVGLAGGREVAGLVAGAAPSDAASELARYVPRVLSLDEPTAAPGVAPSTVAPRIAGLVREHAPAYLIIGATPDGRDLAGMLSVLLGWGILANAVGLSWQDEPVVEMSVFGGRLITSSSFTGSNGIITVRPNVATAEEVGAQGAVEPVATSGSDPLPAVTLVERIMEAGAAAPIEEARIIVAGGRGVGSPDGFRVVEELADVLGGAVGATRAAVDAGWIPYAQQIGQTGKIVKPALYVALGISGAIQHKVGMQTAETIVAVNRDPDAPIAEYADLMVVGDLFDVVPAIIGELRSRSA